MQGWRKIDKERLTVFTDAIIAIIMTLLVLDLKVPIQEINTDYDLRKQLLEQLPHLWGFIISFSMIVIIWFSHHQLIKMLDIADRNFAVLNFLFSGSVATLPFSTALVSEYPNYPIAVFVLASNMLLMNCLLTGMFIYSQFKGLLSTNASPIWYRNIKQKMGLAGVILLLAAVFVSFISTKTALFLIVSVPLMHCIPINERKKKLPQKDIESE